MNSTGEVLRRARNERHLTLDEVATRTRINRKYLEAIESGDRDSIPGGFFYKSFARQYAMALSTDEDNVLDAVDRCLSTEEPAAPPAPDEEVLKALAVKAEETNGGARKGGPSATVYAILLLLAMIGTSGIYILWHRSEQAQAAAQEATRSLPQPRNEAAKPTQPPPTPAPAPEQNAAQTPAAQTPPAQTPALSTDPGLGQPVPSQSEPVQQAQAQPPTTATPVTPPPQQQATSSTAPVPEQPVPSSPQQVAAPPVTADDKIAVSVSAREPTWFSVLADGKRVFSGMIQPGQSRNFSAHEVARLKIGNASGVDVVYNGKPMGVLGGPKQVVMLFLTPETSELVKTQNQAGQPPPLER